MENCLHNAWRGLFSALAIFAVIVAEVGGRHKLSKWCLVEFGSFFKNIRSVIASVPSNDIRFSNNHL